MTSFFEFAAFSRTKNEPKKPEYETELRLTPGATELPGG
jgi:hypothetical protein